MRILQHIFESSLEDVKRYYELIEFLDSVDASQKDNLLSINRESKSINYQLKVEMQQILRANFYLVLYNLIESTQQGIITALKDSITDEGVHVTKLHNKIHTLYFSGLFKDVISDDRKARLALDLMKEASNVKSKVQVDKIVFDKVSGNLDYDNFRSILSQIGCVGRLTVVEADLADAMERTVKLRNKLAHGNDSFSRIGSTLLIQDIKKDYDIITEYLSTSLKYFEEYINKKVYLRKS